MTPQPAFALGSAASTFTPSGLPSKTNTTLVRPPVSSRPATIRMQRKFSDLFNNPFKPKPGQPNTFVNPQPGDPGYKPPAEAPKPTDATKSETKPQSEPGIKLPVVRGISLLQRDFLKSAPEKAGIGRQDRSFTMKPMAGEPGYKPAAYQTVKVSSLGVSPFPDDPNAVGKVGGVEAVIKAAQEVKKGATAKEIKRQILKKTSKLETPKPDVFDIPDYLKPLPEDTPRKGLSWKNYVGR